MTLLFVRSGWSALQIGLRGGLAGSAILALALTASGEARAQSGPDLNRARALFNDGLALAFAHNCPAALAKYREVAAVKMTAQVAFAIAECEEQTGKLVSALGNYRMAQSLATGDAKAEKATEKAPERMAALEVRIPKLTIQRGKGAETVSISLDGTELGDAKLNVAIPVDPGPHVVSARVNEKEVARETVSLEEKESKTFDMTAKVAGFTPPPPPTATEVKPDAPPETPPEAPKKSKALPVGLMVGGGVSIVLGAVFMGLRGGTLSDLDKVCANGHCPPSSESLASKGKTYTGLAELTLGLGGVAAITGVILLATSGDGTADKPKDKDKDAPAAQARRKVWMTATAPGADVAGASFAGRF